MSLTTAAIHLVTLGAEIVIARESQISFKYTQFLMFNLKSLITLRKLGGEGGPEESIFMKFVCINKNISLILEGGEGGEG